MVFTECLNFQNNVFVLSNIELSKEADMKPTLIAITFTTLSLFWGPSPSAFADEARVARGTVAAVSGQAVTVKVGDHDMQFSVDAKTMVEVRGGSTKSARGAAAGKPGAPLDDLLHAGQAVAVTYHDMAGGLHATAIKAIPKAEASAAAKTAMKSAGVVKAIGADWITINGHSGGGASFEQTFKIDAATQVFAKGAGTASKARGGTAPFAELIGGGDHVSVSYHKTGDALFASNVRVTMKAAH
jgi:hypothetical protein